MLDDLREIETNYNVEDIEFGGFKMWPVLRIYFAAKYYSNVDSQSVTTSVFSNFIRNLFYGVKHLFKRYDYLYFSSIDQRKNVDSQFIDKSVDSFCSELGSGLVIEMSSSNHFNKKDVPQNPIISKSIFYFFIFIYSKFFIRSKQIKNAQVLESILNQYEVDIDYLTIMKRVIAQYRLMKILLKFHKPKAVFFVCYYTNMGFIKALREKGIKVIEIQHGLINDSHDAYNVFKEIDNEYYPEFLLTFGSIEKDVFKKHTNNFIDVNKVIPIGNFYTDYILHKSVNNERINKLKVQYKFVVTVTGQNHYTEDILIKFLKDAATKAPDVCVLYVPRTVSKSYDNYGFPKNLIKMDWLNCYESIVQSDFHSTVFSSCALEAPSMGIQNILININNLSKEHFGDILVNPLITQFVNSSDEFIEIIRSMDKLPKNQIVSSNSNIIFPGYKNNIIQFSNFLRNENR